MKKLLSIILAVLIMLTSGMMTAYADGLDGFVVDVFELNINSSNGKIHLNWDDVDGAECYEVFINSNVEYFIVRENVKGTSYDWTPISDITPMDEFVITVYAIDSEGSIIAESNVLNVTVYPYNCDYIGIYGDIDEDKMLSVMDATYIQMYLAKLYDFNSYQEEKADVDNDANITIMDAAFIQMFCAGLYAEGSIASGSFWYGTLEFDVVINSIT